MPDVIYQDTDTFVFIEYQPAQEQTKSDTETVCIHLDVPPNVLFEHINSTMLKLVLAKHGISVSRQKMGMPVLKQMYINHTCIDCPSFLSTFRPIFRPTNALKVKNSKAKKEDMYKEKKKERTTLRTNDTQFKTLRAKQCTDSRHQFPPKPPSETEIARIIQEYCSDISSNKINETGCAVCGQLWIQQDLQCKESIKNIDTKMIL